MSKKSLTIEKPLADRKCLPCRSDLPLLAQSEMQRLLHELPSGWKIIEAHHLEKEFTFPDFRHALNFANLVGRVAEIEDHHPEMQVSFGKVILTIWTHHINGLTESDFILAAKADLEYPTSRQEACF